MALNFWSCPQELGSQKCLSAHFDDAALGLEPQLGVCMLGKCSAVSYSPTAKGNYHIRFLLARLHVTICKSVITDTNHTINYKLDRCVCSIIMYKI